MPLVGFQNQSPDSKTPLAAAGIRLDLVFAYGSQAESPERLSTAFLESELYPEADAETPSASGVPR